MKEKINSALAKLDKANDNHWTGEGFPRLDTVRLLAGEGRITRDDINAAAPGFNREKASAVQAPAAAPAPGASPAAESLPVAAAEPASTLETACQAIVAQINENLGTQALTVQAEVPKTQLELALDELAAAKAELDELREVRAEVIRRFQAQSEAVDRLIKKVEALRPPNGVTNTIQGYLAQQRQLLSERSRRINATKGINLQDFLPTKAPVDNRSRKR